MIDSFTFSIPTKIYFGKNQEENIGLILKERNVQNVLIVNGVGSVVKSGLLQKVKGHIETENIKATELSGVRSNPTIDLHNPDKKTNASNGIGKLVEYFIKIKAPLSYKELGINKPDIDKMVEMLDLDETSKNARCVKYLDNKGAREIYKSLLKEREK